ncbi:glucarate dehydratase family protein [Sphingomonas sp. BIUV-7]|uniref:glucarate dehydratase n=1 Tax=Sphingomonas natans TaxID=3063330 RepID=A0ABT8YBI5_9SPHN|nr:glucarate dehydratase family protein [Sphingomonas sp. BIUV-7]MDO6415005.1 glucarate dehydratase family protein [Sphingomonas sp. BIUV-7]
MKIKRVTVTPIAFRDPPLLNASGIHEPYALRSIIEVEADNGVIGLGESYGDAPVLAALLALREPLVGLSIFDLNGLETRVRAILSTLPPPEAGAELAPGSHPSKQIPNAYSAFEVALLDAQARTIGVPLVELLGGAVRDKVPFSAYLFFKYAAHIDDCYPPDPWGEAIDPAGIVAQAKRMIDAHGFESIKLKAGALEPEVECAAIVALSEAFPGLPLRIDPNGNWSLETAVNCADQLYEMLEYYEDPVPGLQGMADLHRRTGLPLATNMVVTDFDELRQSLSLDSVQIVLSDHHYWGGLRRTQMLAQMCEVFGLGLSMHSNSHLGISLMAMTHLAAATPRLSYACDTHYPWVEEEDEVIVGGKVPIIGGCVAITDAPGLGVELDRDMVAALHDLYRTIDIRSRDDARQMRKYRPDWSTKKPRF